METISRKVENGSEKPKGIDLDRILVEEIGNFGWYQVKTVGLLAIVVIFTATATTEDIFTAARINTRCVIPECEFLSALEAVDVWWASTAVPAGGCQRFANTSAAPPAPLPFCPADLFNRNQTISCPDGIVYEHTNTIVYDFELECNEWRRSLVGPASSVGMLVALPLVGYVSDRWGRRTALAITAFNTAWIGVIRSWANTYTVFLAAEIAESAMGSGSFSACYILVMELVNSRHRVAAGTTVNTFFAIGQVIMGVLAWAVPYWRHLTLVLYVPQLITIFYFWILFESVRWYLSKGRYEEAEMVLKKAAKMNGNSLSESSLLALRKSAQEEKERNLAEEIAEDQPSMLAEVIRYKPVLLRVIVAPLWWISTSFIYHGLAINSVNISGNPYLNFMAVAAVEIPGYWTAFILISWVGRRPVLTGAYVMCAVCQLGYLLIPEGYYGYSLTVYLFGKGSISVVGTAMYVYTAELFPTQYRHSLFAFCSMMGRIGTISAPLTPALGDVIPFILFGGMALVSGLLVLLTPETLGARFPDTIEEAARIGKD